MDEDEAIDEKKTAEGKSSIDADTGVWTVPAPITDDRDQTPKLVSEYAKPSVVKGIRLKYLPVTVEGVVAEPLEISFIVSSKRSGEDVFSEVVDAQKKQPVGCSQFSVPNLFIVVKFSERIHYLFKMYFFVWPGGESQPEGQCGQDLSVTQDCCSGRCG